MSHAKIVSSEQWLAARKALLVEEKKLTRHRDAVNAARRRLPMVEIKKDCVFEGPAGSLQLLDLFEGRRASSLFTILCSSRAIRRPESPASLTTKVARVARSSWIKVMAHYVDGFVLPIRKDKVDLYRSIARDAGEIWREHGALEYRECIAEDLDAKEMVSFLQLAGATADETIVFAWIVFQSRASRDEVNAKVIADPRLKGMCEKGEMPFDYKRMAYGGFETLVEA